MKIPGAIISKRESLILIGLIAFAAILDALDFTTGSAFFASLIISYVLLDEIKIKILTDRFAISNMKEELKPFETSTGKQLLACLAIGVSSAVIDTPEAFETFEFISIAVLIAATFSPLLSLPIRSIRFSKDENARVLRASRKLASDIMVSNDVWMKRKSKPKFAFYFSGGDLETPMHYLVWKKYLDGLDTPYVIILRERKHLAFFQTKEYKDIPVLLATSGKGIGGIIPSSVTTIFYANNGFKNLEVINARPELRHVQLLHGDSDKPSSYSPVVRCYTDLFVSGQMAIDRYAANSVSLNQVQTTVVGRPQTEDINVVEDRGDKDEITIAYMPTWLGYHEEARFSSLEQSPQIIRDVLNHDFGAKVHILFKAHPMSYKDPNAAVYFNQIKDAIAASPKNTAEIVDINVDAITLFNRSDVLIADISSVVIDFLYSKKPYLITNPNNFDLNDLSRYPCTQGGYLLTPAADNVVASLEEALGPDRLSDLRTTKLRNYAFGDSHMKPGQLFRQEALAIINRKH